MIILCCDLQAFVINHPDQARQLLVKHPQLSYALFQALLLNKIVDSVILERMLASSRGGAAPPPPPQAPVRPPMGAPPPHMQQQYPPQQHYMQPMPPFPPQGVHQPQSMQPPPMAAPPPAASPAVDAATAGIVTATVTFEGEAPVPDMITITGDPKCVSENGGPQRAEEKIVVGQNQSLQNVFVYVKDGLAGFGAFDGSSSPARRDGNREKVRWTPTPRVKRSTG